MPSACVYKLSESMINHRDATRTELIPDPPIIEINLHSVAVTTRYTERVRMYRTAAVTSMVALAVYLALVLDAIFVTGMYRDLLDQRLAIVIVASSAFIGGFWLLGKRRSLMKSVAVFSTLDRTISVVEFRDGSEKELLRVSDIVPNQVEFDVQPAASGQRTMLRKDVDVRVRLDGRIVVLGRCHSRAKALKFVAQLKDALASISLRG